MLLGVCVAWPDVAGFCPCSNDENPGLKFTKLAVLRKLLSLKFILAFIASG